MTAFCANTIWRGMTPDDLEAVTTLADTIHADYPEDTAIFAERLRLAPEGCLVLEHEGKLSGYLISHPWRGLVCPPLNTLLVTLPQPADRWYLHDIALAPTVRGGGHAREAVEHARSLARQNGLRWLTLTSTGPARTFWLAQGFMEEQPTAEERAILASYDPQAQLLSCPIPPEGEA